MKPSTVLWNNLASGTTRARRGSRSAGSRGWLPALAPLVAIAAVVVAMRPAAAVTYTYSSGQNWSVAANWVGGVAPTFDTQADLIFDSAIGTNAMRISSDRIVRSLTFGANLVGSTTTTVDVLNRNNANDANRTLTLSAASGNATITMASGILTNLIRLGGNNNGDTILTSSLDLYTNDATKPFLFDGPVTGGGAINKYGVGRATATRGNSFSGGLNIFEGTFVTWSNGGSAGTGTVTVGEASSSNNATWGVGSTQTRSNTVVVSAGSGTRTISLSDQGNGNPTLSGGMTLNKDVTFDIEQIVASTNERITVSGAIFGAGGIVKNGTGDLRLTGSNTYSGATTVNGGGFGYVTILADSGLGAAPGSPTASHLVLNGGGLVNAANFTLSANRGIELVGDGGLIFTNTGTELDYGGIMAGTSFIKDGTGLLTLGGDNTYAGTTTVSAGGLIIDGTHSGVGLASVASGARIGGTGSLAGGLTLASGGLFVFNPDDPTLNVVGTVALDDTFSVASLVNLDGTAINWVSVANGIYTLIGTTASTFDNITNFGSGDPYDIGAGRTAYFTNGSLNLVVVPEPSTFALLGGVAAVGVFMMRRRRTIG
jgi:fibronectin-binding autotransporter adhesin